MPLAADRRDEAQKQVAAAKVALEKANNPDQAQFFPYLTGYVAFYGGDYKTAITELEKASQEDPFILVLLAQSYEKAGDAARAREYYGKVMANNGHGPTECFCAPAGEEETGWRVGPIVLWPLYLALAQEYWVGTKPPGHRLTLKRRTPALLFATVPILSAIRYSLVENPPGSSD